MQVESHHLTADGVDEPRNLPCGPQTPSKQGEEWRAVMSISKMFGEELTPSHDNGLTGRGVSFAALAPMILSLVLFWPFGTAGSQKAGMTAGTVDPSAEGTVYFHDTHNGNTAVDARVKYLAQPSSLKPSESVYVVWIQPNGQAPINEGALVVNKNLDGQLKTETPYKRFRLFVTAEQFDRVKAPSGPQVLSANVTQG